MPKLSKTNVKPTRFVLIRHGETEWNRHRRYQGSTDIELLDASRQKAKKLAKHLHEHHPCDFLYVSPLKRAYETASIINHSLNKRLRLKHDLQEMHFGDWEGKTGKQLIEEKDPAYMKWVNDGALSPPGGETYKAFKQRVVQALDEIIEKHLGKSIFIVAHGGVHQVILLRLLNLPAKYLFSFEKAPGSFSIVDLYDQSAKLIMLNHFIK